MKKISDIIWSDDALNDVELAKKYYIQEGDKVLARHFLTEVQQKILQLYDLPHLGRIGEVFGTKELILQKFPFKVIYKIQESHLFVIAFIHQKQLYPKNN